MKKIEVIPGIKSSVLGFGCAPVAGSVDKATARKAIEKAIGLGINHFDLARSYGYGEAESFVGGILKPNRQEMVIATKFGIEVTAKGKLLTPLKPLVRMAKGFMPKKPSAPVQEVALPNQNAISDSFHRRIAITSENLNSNIEKSLKALKTDYIDYYFVHEPYESIAHIEDVLDAANRLKEQGKIRAFGIAFMQNQRTLHSQYLDKFDVWQFNNSAGSTGYEAIKAERGAEPNIFFMPIKGGDPALSAEEKLKKLHQDFPKSVLLCSMFSEKHIENNSKLFL